MGVRAPGVQRARCRGFDPHPPGKAHAPGFCPASRARSSAGALFAALLLVTPSAVEARFVPGQGSGIEQALRDYALDHAAWRIVSTMLHDFGAFLGISALVIATPGQDTALVIRNSLAGGRRGGVFTTLGVVAGQATWTLASGAGLTALLIASRPAFAALRIAGAAYLVWLGARSLVHALRRDGSKVETEAEHDPRRRSAPAAFRQGLLSALGNPKLAVFFVSLFPQFIPAGRPSIATLLALGLTFCLMTLLWLTGYSIVIGRAGHLLIRPRARRALEAALGATLAALGLRLAIGHGFER